MIVIVRAKVRHKIGTSVGIQLLFVGNPLSCIGKSLTWHKVVHYIKSWRRISRPSPSYISHFTFFFSQHALHAARSSQSSQCCREDGHHHLDDVPPEILVLHNDKQTLSVLRTSPPWRGRAVRFVGHFVLKVNTWFEFSLGAF